MQLPQAPSPAYIAILSDQPCIKQLANYKEQQRRDRLVEEERTVAVVGYVRHPVPMPTASYTRERTSRRLDATY